MLAFIGVDLRDKAFEFLAAWRSRTQAADRSSECSGVGLLINTVASTDRPQGQNLRRSSDSEP